MHLPLQCFEGQIYLTSAACFPQAVNKDHAQPEAVAASLREKLAELRATVSDFLLPEDIIFRNESSTLYSTCQHTHHFIRCVCSLKTARAL